MDNTPDTVGLTVSTATDAVAGNANTPMSDSAFGAVADGSIDHSHAPIASTEDNGTDNVSDKGDAVEGGDAASDDKEAGLDGLDLTSEEAPTSEPPLSKAVQSAIQQAVAQAVAPSIAAAVSASVDQSVSAAVASVIARMEATVREHAEANLMEHIRVCGQRPHENGTHGAGGVRMHPAVDRLTRKDRAALAERAAHGETVRL